MRTSALISSCLLASTILASSTAYAASDAELDALKSELKLLSKRINELEQEQKIAQKEIKKAQNASAKVVTTTQNDVVTAGAMPGSFKIPGTNTSMKFGGFVKLDAIYDANHAYGGQFGNFASIPLEGSVLDRQDAEFNAHARNSRVNFTTLTPTDMGVLKTFIEVDFFGSARGNANTTNGEGLQLRHVYGEVGGVLAGQTWSNFMDLAAYPESLDYVGPVGISFVRQAQVRYTSELDDNWSYAIALEAPQTGFTPTTTGDTDLSDTPDLTARFVYNNDFGHLALRGLARKLNAYNSTTGVEDEAFGWGLGLSGMVKVLEDDTFKFSGVYGDGLGHYLLEVASSGNGSTFVGGNLEPQTVYGGYMNYMHTWADDWRSNFIAGYSGMDNNVALTGAAVNKEIVSGHVNLLWQPVPTYTVGVEYMHAYRELESGAEGKLNRLQASFIYKF